MKFLKQFTDHFNQECTEDIVTVTACYVKLAETPFTFNALLKFKAQRKSIPRRRFGIPGLNLMLTILLFRSLHI